MKDIYGNDVTLGNYGTLSNVISANERVGQTYFSKENIRFFRAKVYGDEYGICLGGLFIESVRFVDSITGYSGPREYAVKAADESGYIHQMTEYGTLRQAKKDLTRLCKEYRQSA